MYQPRHFDPDRAASMHALMRAHPLAMLVTPGADGAPSIDAVPMLLDLDGASPQSPHGTLIGHVARANPLWRDADGREVLALFKGPDAYVSPNWYAAKAEHGKVVPTWNYVVVQARGRLRSIDDAGAVRRVVERLTTCHEAAQPAPWALADAPDDYVAAMLRAIVAIEISLASLDGKFKLGQNRSTADRAGVVAGLRQMAASGSDAVAGDPQGLARWMAALPDIAG